MDSFFSSVIQKITVVIASIVITITGVFTGQKSVSTLNPSPIVEQNIQSPSPSVKPTSTPKSAITEKKVVTQPKNNWAFTKDQYDITVSNVIYETKEVKSGFDLKLDYINGDLTIKNISVQSFITGYQLLNQCEIVKDGQLTKFKLGSFFSDIFRKALLPGESTTFHFENWFVSGGEYDSQGNIIQPPSGLKVRSCTFTVKTKDNSNIEPKVATFSTL